MKCNTPYCRNKRAKHRTICWKCDSRKKRAKNPIRASFNDLRSNAKRRDRHFDLSYEYFRTFVLENGYMENKGRGKGRLHIDRIKHHLGYIEGNIQVLFAEENCRKSYTEKLTKSIIIEGDIIVGPESDIDF